MVECEAGEIELKRLTLLWSRAGGSLSLTVGAASMKADQHCAGTSTEAESLPVIFSTRITRIIPAPIAVPWGSLDSLGIINHTMRV